MEDILKTPLKPGTESLAFSSRELAAELASELRGQGIRHISRRTDQIDGRMHWIVSWPTAEQLRLDAEETKVLLTEAEKICNMENQGGNTNEN